MAKPVFLNLFGVIGLDREFDENFGLIPQKNIQWYIENFATVYTSMYFMHHPLRPKLRTSTLSAPTAHYNLSQMFQPSEP